MFFRTIWIFQFNKKARVKRGLFDLIVRADEAQSTLASLKARVRLVNHVNTSATTNDPVGAMTPLQGFQGISNFHGTISVR